jgi:hypothetical protein
MTRSQELDTTYRDYLAPGETTGKCANPLLDDLIDKMRWAESRRATRQILDVAQQGGKPTSTNRLFCLTLA